MVLEAVSTSTWPSGARHPGRETGRRLARAGTGSAPTAPRVRCQWTDTCCGGGLCRLNTCHHDLLADVRDVNRAMRWTLDLDANALYVYFGHNAPVRQRVMADGTIVDVDEAGELVGIEVVRPGAAWDIDAVVDEFGLDGEAGSALRALAMSPILQVPLARPDIRLEVRVEATSTTTMTTSSHVPRLVRGLVAA